MILKASAAAALVLALAPLAAAQASPSGGPAPASTALERFLAKGGATLAVGEVIGLAQAYPPTLPTTLTDR